jgi:hypothetical protein
LVLLRYVNLRTAMFTIALLVTLHREIDRSSTKTGGIALRFNNARRPIASRNRFALAIAGVERRRRSKRHIRLGMRHATEHGIDSITGAQGGKLTALCADETGACIQALHPCIERCSATGRLGLRQNRSAIVMRDSSSQPTQSRHFVISAHSNDVAVHSVGLLHWMYAP